MTRKSNKTYIKRGPNSLKELNQQRDSVKELSSIWNDLTQLQMQCQQLNQTPTQVIQLLRNQNLVNSITDKVALHQLATILNKDIIEFGTSLTNINLQAEQYRGQVVDPMMLHTLMDLATAYDQWITSYQLVVVPTAIQITELFNNPISNTQV